MSDPSVLGDFKDVGTGVIPLKQQKVDDMILGKAIYERYIMTKAAH